MSIAFNSYQSLFTCDHCAASGVTENLSGRLPEGWSLAHIQFTRTGLGQEYPSQYVCHWCPVCSEFTDPNYFAF